jgi:hypothetical protein
LDDRVVVIREFCKEEVVMSETKRMAEEANRIGEEVQERTQRMGREHQNAVERGFETASRSLSEANKGFQTLAAEMTDFSKQRWEAVFHAWEQLVRARSFGDVVEVQTQYAQRAFESYTSEMSKLGEMCLGTARSASKPVEDATRTFR